jgi:hypothetical protein
MKIFALFNHLGPGGAVKAAPDRFARWINSTTRKKAGESHENFSLSQCFDPRRH